MFKHNLLRLSLQYFADSGADGGAAGTGEPTGEPTGAAGTGEPTGTGQQTQQQNDDSARIEKLVQSKVDRITADLGKKNADLQKQLDKMKREKMSDDEIKQLEITEREKSIAEKEKALADKENRLYAIKAIKTAGLDDGSDSALELVDFVMSDGEEAINGKVTAFKTLVDKMVAAQVDKTFKANGRVPNGAGNGAQTDGKDGKDNIAVQLGKMRAEQTKKSTDILNFYTGGKK